MDCWLFFMGILVQKKAFQLIVITNKQLPTADIENTVKFNYLSFSRKCLSGKAKRNLWNARWSIYAKNVKILDTPWMRFYLPRCHIERLSLRYELIIFGKWKVECVVYIFSLWVIMEIANTIWMIEYKCPFLLYVI